MLFWWKVEILEGHFLAENGWYRGNGENFCFTQIRSCQPGAPTCFGPLFPPSSRPSAREISMLIPPWASINEWYHSDIGKKAETATICLTTETSSQKAEFQEIKSYGIQTLLFRDAFVAAWCAINRPLCRSLSLKECFTLMGISFDIFNEPKFKITVLLEISFFQGPCSFPQLGFIFADLSPTISPGWTKNGSNQWIFKVLTIASVFSVTFNIFPLQTTDRVSH